MKEFLNDSLNDHYQVYRGGNIINFKGDKSPQLDIILTNKNTLKLFGDKGIYPIETIIGVFSITSNLTKGKLKKCIQEIGKIPKHNYDFSIEKFYGEEFRIRTHDAWRHIVPFSCIFGFNGNIKEDWINEIKQEIDAIANHSLWPSIIIVNKKGMFEKQIHRVSEEKFELTYKYTDLSKQDVYGFCFSKILFNLYNMSAEQTYMRPKYENYFEKDYLGC